MVQNTQDRSHRRDGAASGFQILNGREVEAG
ncbi:hypothetical protein CHKEEEPN_4927 [Methylorubrum podarium]|nr:hypothetical protein CHKEEEPN_4927 [Methylorubrum podarium]